jgi:small ligand-binding sensory domain FIST
MATAALGSRRLEGLLARAGDMLQDENWLGASAEGLVLAGREVVGLPGFAVAAFSGVEAELFCCEGLAGREAEAGHEIADRLSGSPQAGDSLIVFADSLNLDLEPLLRGLQTAAGPAQVMGMGASELPGDSPRVWASGHFIDKGCCGLWLRSPQSPRIAVTQGTAPISEEREVTRVRGRWVLGLDGEPALACLHAAGGNVDDGALTRNVLAQVRGAGRDKQAGAAVLRNLVGLDAQQEAFALSLPPRPGDRLAFVRLDSAVARQDLASGLAGLGTEPAGLGLYFSCPSRGQKLFQDAGFEGAALARTLGAAPLLGMMGAFQLAPDPLGGAPLLHTYSGVFALFDAEQAAGPGA